MSKEKAKTAKIKILRGILVSGKSTPPGSVVKLSIKECARLVHNGKATFDLDFKIATQTEKK